MKTSKILTALVLPAMLAACTAEDIVTTNNVAQSERPLLSEDFRLISEGEGDGVNSRFYMAGSSTLTPVWEDGDKYGAALIDQYNPAYPKNPEYWTVIPSLAGNTPFIYDAAAEEWKAIAATGVGHYLFSFPYNINDQNRAAVSWEIPTIQELYGEDGELDLNATINKYNKSVAAALLKENATSHAVKMRNLFSYPKFVVKFDNGLPITTVSQVVLELDSDTKTFATKGGFHHENVWALFNPENIEDVVGKDKTFESEDEYWASKQTADFIIKDEVYSEAETDEEGNETKPAVGYDVFTESASSKYIVAKLPENTKVKLDNDNNKYVEVRFMIPGDVIDREGGLYSAEHNLKMHVYTNNGVYTVVNLLSQIDFKSTTSEETQNRVFARNASYTLNLKNLEDKGKELYIVTDVQDWNDLVSKYGASAAYTDDNKLEVAVVGEDFTLNSTAKMPTKAEFAVTTDITIDGNVTLKNVFVESNKVIVKKGATLNIADNSNTIKNIENYGTLNFKKAVVASRAEVIEEIVNVEEVNNMPNAVLNIEKDAEAAFKLNNNKETIIESLDHGKVVVAGTLTLNGGANYGEIVNNSYVVVAGAFTNEADYHIGTCDVEHEKCQHFTPVVTNNASFVADGAEFKNNGNFVNAATGNVSCAGGAEGKFNNAAGGYIKATKGGTLLISTNAGTIELDEHTQTKWSVDPDGTMGNIKYVAKATETTLSFSTSAVTELVIGDQNMSITATGQLNNVTMGTGTLTLPKYNAEDADADENNANDTELDGTLTLKGDVVIASELAGIKNLKIEEGASLTINKNNKVQTETVANYGAVLVAGQFASSATTEEDATPAVGTKVPGVFKSTQGSSNNIDFYVPADALKTAFETALENLVTAFADNGIVISAYESQLKSWDDVTVDAITGEDDLDPVFSWGWSDEWIKDAAEEVINAYNGLKDTELKSTADDGGTVDDNKTSMAAIFADTTVDLEAAITAAKATAKDNLDTAIETAIANKQLDAGILSSGYAYVGVATDLNAMWTEYGTELLSEMANWTVVDSETGLPEKKYAVGTELKGSYEFAIKAEILAKVGESTSISFDIPAGAYVNASKGSDKTTASEAVYNVVKAYLSYYNVITPGAAVSYDFEDIQDWCFDVKKLDEEGEDFNKDQYNAKNAIKDYAATFIGLDPTDDEYSEKNITALAKLIQLSMVSNVTSLKNALSAGISVIELSGKITLDAALTIDKNVIIKGGEIAGFTVEVAAPSVVFDGVKFGELDGTTARKKNQIEIKAGVEKLVVKNCTFEGFKYDAIQTGSQNQEIEVVIEGNTFIAPAARITNGSYISLGFGNGKASVPTAWTDAKVSIKNNNFDKFDNVDHAIKIYGVKDLSKVVMGGNKIATAVANVQEGQIIISKSNDQTKERYSKADAYAALTASPAAALSNEKATVSAQ